MSFGYWTTGGAGEQFIYIARPRQASAVQTLESVKATCLRPRPVQQKSTWRQSLEQEVLNVKRRYFINWRFKDISQK